MWKYARATAVLAVAAAVSLAATGMADAAAAPHHWMNTNEPGIFDPGGRVDFWPDGDRVQLCDRLPDGASAVADVYDFAESPNTLFRLKAGGQGQCDTSSQNDNNLREGACISVEIYLMDGSQVVRGSEDWAGWRNYNDAEGTCD